MLFFSSSSLFFRGCHLSHVQETTGTRRRLRLVQLSEPASTFRKQKLKTKGVQLFRSCFEKAAFQ